MYANLGLARSKVVVVPESVDVHLFGALKSPPPPNFNSEASKSLAAFCTSPCTARFVFTVALKRTVASQLIFPLDYL